MTLVSALQRQLAASDSFLWIPDLLFFEVRETTSPYKICALLQCLEFTQGRCIARLFTLSIAFM